MRVAIIGYGKMGREIEKILVERGHSIGLVIDAQNADELNSESLRNIDVALEFTTPDTAYANIRTCIECGVAVVSGTTGWTERLDELKTLCEERHSALFYASNFSLGVNLMFRLNRRLAQIMNRVEGYDVTIEEIHHIQKKDAPSGTAITLAEGIIEQLNTKTNWVNHTPPTPEQLHIHSVREGMTPGTHTVTYESEDDMLQIRHTIKNRRTLALGAIIAAEFLCGKQGIYTMDDLID